MLKSVWHFVNALFTEYSDDDDDDDDEEDDDDEDEEVEAKSGVKGGSAAAKEGAEVVQKLQELEVKEKWFIRM